jgi:hypothetical protein
VTEDKQADAVAKAFQKKLDLLEATRTQYFTDKGLVTDNRTQAIESGGSYRPDDGGASPTGLDEGDNDAHF